MSGLEEYPIAGSRQYVDKTESSIRVVSLATFLIIFSLSWFAYVLLRWEDFLVAPVESARMSMISLLILYLAYGAILLFAILCYVFGPWLMVRKLNTRPLGETFSSANKIVVECSKLAGVKAPKTFLIKEPSADCFIVGRSKNSARLLVSQPLLESLTDEELQTMVLHELGHIRNGDMAFMTWCTSFQRSLKYWVAFYVIAMFGGLILLERAQMSAFIVFRMIFMGSVLEPPIIFLILISVFITAIANSVSRIREHLADAYTSTLVGSSKLVSAIKETHLLQLVVSAMDKKAGRFGRKLNRLRSLTPKFLIDNYIRHHPSLKNRVESIRNSTFVVSSNEIHLPSPEAYVYLGVAASLVLIGMKEFLFNLVMITNNAINVFSTWIGFYLMILPSLILITALNCRFAFQQDPGAYAKKSGSKVYVDNSFLRDITARLGVSSVVFFFLSFFGFFPLYELFIATFNPYPVVLDILGAFLSSASVSFLLFLLSVLALFAVVACKVYKFKSEVDCLVENSA